MSWLITKVFNKGVCTTTLISSVSHERHLTEIWALLSSQVVCLCGQEKAGNLSHVQDSQPSQELCAST